MTIIVQSFLYLRILFMKIKVSKVSQVPQVPQEFYLKLLCNKSNVFSFSGF